MTFTDTLLITFTPTDAICYTYCDGTVQAAVTGGNTATQLQYDWSTGVSGPGANAIIDLCAGDYALTVTDDNGCIGSNSVTISQPVQLEIDSLDFEPVVCSGDCNGRVFVYDAQAVEYS
jgi:hypothetical protein